MRIKIKNKYFIITLLSTLVWWAVFATFNVWATTSSISATIQIRVCGNGTAESGEDCDGSDKNDATCLTLGFTGGSLTCDAACDFITSACTSGGGGGGGGGGGSSVTPPTSATVKFTGKAYPKSAITLLKDAQVAGTTVAGANAEFEITLANLSAGNYIFSVYGEDYQGRRSISLSFPVGVTKGTITNVSGIFIAPSIGVDKSEVKQGDNIAIFGQSAPQSNITIVVNSDDEYFATAKSDNSGIYLYTFDTSPLAAGQHFTKAKSSVNNEISIFSKTISFAVGTKNVVFEEPQKTKADTNGDGRVNLVDFSIAAYWYKRPSPPAAADLNSDGKVNLVDFSIMAYYWTG